MNKKTLFWKYCWCVRLATGLASHCDKEKSQNSSAVKCCNAYANKIA